MSTTADWTRPGNPVVAPKFRQANAWLVALAVLAACLGGLGAAYGFGRASHGTPVLVMAKTVLQGEVIEVSDLAVAEVTVTGVPMVDATQRDTVAGQRALVTLAAGALLAPDTFGQPPVGVGMAQVRLRLAPGRLPSGPLPGGTALTLIGLPRSDLPSTPVLVIGVTVIHPPVVGRDGVAMLDVAVLASEVGRLAPFLFDDSVLVVLPA